MIIIDLSASTTKQGLRDLNVITGRRINGTHRRKCRHPFWAVFVCRETFAGVDEDGYDIYINYLQCEDCDEQLGPESQYDVYVQPVDRPIDTIPVLTIEPPVQ